ncbi:hypothetical protein VF21_00667 [Pseudogymnoascus sp. 05NY08]|nr:hypothetical protein VF21_00667 [Pseudogymnoascus sp. 05NY08]
MKTLPNALVWTASLLAIVSQTIAAALPDLRILPLGDSITKGSLSSDGNGYLNYLETKLENYDPDSFTTVDMIGTIHTDGSMKDKDHEGHSGEYVENIVTYWQKPFGAGPNVVLLHVGTNNMDLNRNVAEAPGLYSTMLDEMYKKLPNAFIIVCKVIHSKNAELNARASDFNAKLEKMVKQRRAAGRPIAIIDMGLVDSDIKDEKHPTDLGYAKMANGWYKAIVDGNVAGLIKSHGTSDIGGVGVGVGSGGDNGASTGSAGCEGGNWKRIGKIFDDFKVWEDKGSIKGGADDFAYDKLILADLDGDGFDDYILADNDGKVRAWKNNGGGMTSLGYIQPDWADLDITGDMVRMADVTGDGKADMIVLYKDGASKVWKNTGDGKKFESLDSKWATGLASREKVHILDMDGDGYADYVVLYDGGAVSWARNTHNNGADSNKKNWESLVEIAPGVGGAPPKSVHLVDLDGDKRAGKLPLYIKYPPPVTKLGDGLADYLIVYGGSAVKAWLNNGNIGRQDGQRLWDGPHVIAPGVAENDDGSKVRFADLNGDGFADYLVLYEGGAVDAWLNQQQIPPNGRQIWRDKETVATGAGVPGSKVRFVQLNDDGKAEYVVQYDGGAAKAFLNTGDIPGSSDTRNWIDIGVVAGGVGEPGPVFYADIDGDGKDDYSVFHPLASLVGGDSKLCMRQQDVRTPLL